MAKTSQVQLEATRRWREKNKARITYSDYRLALNTFVAGKGKLSEVVGSDVQTGEYINDLEVLYEMVSERIKELE